MLLRSQYKSNPLYPVFGQLFDEPFEMYDLTELISDIYNENDRKVVLTSTELIRRIKDGAFALQPDSRSNIRAFVTSSVTINAERKNDLRQLKQDYAKLKKENAGLIMSRELAITSKDQQLLMNQNLRTKIKYLKKEDERQKTEISELKATMKLKREKAKAEIKSAVIWTAIFLTIAIILTTVLYVFQEKLPEKVQQALPGAFLGASITLLMTLILKLRDFCYFDSTS